MPQKEMAENSVDDIKNDLRKRIERARIVLNELKTSQGWRTVMEDFEAVKRKIDENWHLVADKGKLEELRVTKMAASSILMTLENYEHDLKQAEKQLYEFENPDLVTSKDYDTE